MGELDKGFQNLFDRIGTSLKENKQQYKEQIQEMQEFIRKITACGVKLEALEKKIRMHSRPLLRRSIKKFMISG